MFVVQKRGPNWPLYHLELSFLDWLRRVLVRIARSSEPGLPDVNGARLKEQAIPDSWNESAGRSTFRDNWRRGGASQGDKGLRNVAVLVPTKPRTGERMAAIECVEVQFPGPIVPTDTG